MGLELRMLWRMFYHRQVHSFNVAGCAKLHIWIDWLAAINCCKCICCHRGWYMHMHSHFETVVVWSVFVSHCEPDINI